MDLEKPNLDLLQQWTEAKEQLKKWQDAETKLREQVVSALFSSAKEEGTATLTIQGGWKIKVAKKLNYTLNNKEGQVTAIFAALPQEVATSLIKWNPELSVTAYRKLDAETQGILNGCLTIKPAKPTLDLVPPDAGKT